MFGVHYGDPDPLHERGEEQERSAGGAIVVLCDSYFSQSVLMFFNDFTQKLLID